MPTKLEKMMADPNVEVLVIDPGRTVVCDFCDKNFTESPESGGLLFQSNAVGPCCAERIEENARGYGEEHLIRDRCPEGKPFADWVREDLR